MVTFAAWSAQNPPFEHHKNETTEGPESTRANNNNNNNITKQGITERENYATSLSGGKEQNHHNGFLATLKQSSNIIERPN